MKYVVRTTLAIFILALNGLGQNHAEAIKLDAFERNGGGGCEEYFRITYLLDEIAKNEGSMGLIVIYAGSDRQRFGNLKAYVRGADRFITKFLKAPPDKIKIFIADGKQLFKEEYWLIPKGASFPEIANVTFDWETISSKYHFANACLQCEPSYPALSSFQPNFDDFADLLRDRKDYLGMIEVYDYVDLISVRHSLTQSKLPRERYRIRLLKALKAEYPNMSVNLYILPKTAARNNLIVK